MSIRIVLVLIVCIIFIPSFGATPHLYALRGESEEIWLHNKLLCGYIMRNEFVEIDLLVNSDEPQKYIYKKSIFKDHILAEEYFYEASECRAMLMILYKQQKKVPRFFGLGHKWLEMSGGFRFWDLSQKDAQAQYIPCKELPALKERFRDTVARWMHVAKRHIKHTLGN